MGQASTQRTITKYKLRDVGNCEELTEASLIGIRAGAADKILAISSSSWDSREGERVAQGRSLETWYSSYH